MVYLEFILGGRCIFSRKKIILLSPWSRHWGIYTHLCKLLTTKIPEIFRLFVLKYITYITISFSIKSVWWLRSFQYFLGFLYPLRTIHISKIEIIFPKFPTSLVLILVFILIIKVIVSLLILNNSILNLILNLWKLIILFQNTIIHRIYQSIKITFPMRTVIPLISKSRIIIVIVTTVFEGIGFRLDWILFTF